MTKSTVGLLCGIGGFLLGCIYCHYVSKENKEIGDRNERVKKSVDDSLEDYNRFMEEMKKVRESVKKNSPVHLDIEQCKKDLENALDFDNLIKQAINARYGYDGTK